MTRREMKSQVATIAKDIRTHVAIIAAVLSALGWKLAPAPEVKLEAKLDTHIAKHEVLDDSTRQSMKYARLLWAAECVKQRDPVIRIKMECPVNFP